MLTQLQDSEVSALSQLQQNFDLFSRENDFSSSFADGKRENQRYNRHSDDAFQGTGSPEVFEYGAPATGANASQAARIGRRTKGANGSSSTNMSGGAYLDAVIEAGETSEAGSEANHPAQTKRKSNSDRLLK